MAELCRKSPTYMKQRIIGFDLARAYAILGMYIVNFNTVFGSLNNQSVVGHFLRLFNGNSSTIFVMLAGMGVALMTNRPLYTAEEKSRLRRVVARRSWFLFGLGLLFYVWWPADILHFYGGYLHLAVPLLFLPKKYYLWAAVGAVVVFHGLLAVLPYETGWNFNTLVYHDFWSIWGFLRNTFYNGWNPIFPWFAFFMLGMWLGRLDWQNPTTRHGSFWAGLVVYLAVLGTQQLAGWLEVEPDLLFYLTADYLPPFLTFMLSTGSFGLMLIASFMWLGNRAHGSAWAGWLAKTGKMTLSHYIAHLTLGLGALALVSGHPLELRLNGGQPLAPETILVFASGYFLLSGLFSHYWSQKFANGPLETLMRKFSG
jgi:uncharacterized membrane protein YeiB